MRFEFGTNILTSTLLEEALRGAQGGTGVVTPPEVLTLIDDGAGNTQVPVPEGGSIDIALNGRPTVTLTNMPGDEDIGFLYPPEISGSGDVGSTLSVDLGTVYFQGEGPITIQQDALRGGTVIASDIRPGPGPQVVPYTVQASDIGVGVTLRSRLTNGANTVEVFTDIVPAISLAPLQLGATLWADMGDPTQLTVLSGGAGNEVAQVENKADPANPLTQSVITDRPRRVSNAINGQTALRFTPNDVLRPVTPLTIRAMFFVTANVTQSNGIAPIFGSLFDQPLSNQQYTFLRSDGRTDYDISVDGAGTAAAHSATVHVDTGASGNGENIDLVGLNIALDGLAPAEREALRLWYVAYDQDQTLVDAFGAMRTSVEYFNNGTLFGEIITFPTALTTAQANAVANEIAPKWGLNWTDIT